MAIPMTSGCNVCDLNKVSDFSTVNGPDGNVIDLDAYRAEA
jgi:hypothetical protein